MNQFDLSQITGLKILIVCLPMYDYVLLPAQKKAKIDLCCVLVCLLEHIQHQATMFRKIYIYQ